MSKLFADSDVFKLREIILITFIKSKVQVSIMKKLFYLLFAAPFLFLTGCSDDDKLPDVDLTVTFQDCAVSKTDNTIYVVKGNNFEITSVNLVVNEDKKGDLGVVNYYIDGYRIGASVEKPYSATIVTENMQAGTYLLNIEAGIYVVDYPVSIGVVGYDVKIVTDSSEIPADAVQNPSVSGNVRISSGK